MHRCENNVMRGQSERLTPTMGCEGVTRNAGEVSITPSTSSLMYG